VKKLAVFLAAAALMFSAGAALAQSTFTVPFSPVGNSGVEGHAILTAAGEGTNVSLDITGLAPGSTAIATLHAGSCAAPGASFAELPDLAANAEGRATAEGQVLYRGTESVALDAIADGEHIISISQAGQMVACAWIPQAETAPRTPAGMPRTGNADLLLIAASLAAIATVALGGGLALRRR